MPPRLTRSASAARARSTQHKAGRAKTASSVATGSKRRREDDDVEAVLKRRRQGDKEPDIQFLLPSWRFLGQHGRVPRYPVDSSEDGYTREDPVEESPKDDPDESTGTEPTPDGYEDSSSSEDESDEDSEEGEDPESDPDSSSDSS
ncbi:hypothetical protein V499_09174 [Pseudogymnoascus sp. VKM F-103]|uniref:Uncharacterized protein n=1 Tax=Pseudogymnoascus verrucosus TaxID=342668 RepID=A0A1B8GRQ3_9PEZI|nr:uncharacterized protein VE01_03670 [Pseudogymnoascus verrucosus]KFY70432.1 hypothetical protein V499_09174 [Pseudogymnoascus sp. VKM F-103]OBT98508.1 hypothetical protein VE01_03670 [Pseudogymnoascus verrucosus]